MKIKNFFTGFTQDFSRIYPLLTNQLRRRCFFIFTMMIIQSLLELFFILSLTQMSLAITNPDALRSNIIYKTIFYISPFLGEFASNPKQLLILVGINVVLLNALKNVISYFAARSVAYLGEDISLGIGQEIMTRFLYQNYAWHLSPESHYVYQRMTWREILGAMLTEVLTLYATIVTALILFFSLMGSEPVLTTLVVAMTSVIGYLLFRGIKQTVDINAQKVAQSSQEETTALLCATNGIREVLIYYQQETFLKSLANAALKGRTPRTFTGIANTLPTWVLESVGFFMVVFSVVYLVYVEQADMGRISSALSLLVLTAWRILPYSNRAVSLQINIRSLRPRAYAVIELLEKLRARPNEPRPEPAKDFAFNDEICLKDLGFCYVGDEWNTLNDINLTIKKGEKVGLIGASGGGKTTLAGVLCGLLPPSNGEFLIDGVPLNENRRVAFAKQIGYVPQSPFLFAATLAENIAFSDWGKQWDENRIAEACKQASIDFVDNHPKGILQPIGENGAGLSGGQAQRVSIARAMYTKPSLLIFDEATSALDQHNEKSIQQTIENLAGKITCVIIAHRLTTVQHCDKIIWINAGRIVMCGTPEEVISKYLEKNPNDATK